MFIKTFFSNHKRSVQHLQGHSCYRHEAQWMHYNISRGCLDHMVFGFTNTSAISVYHH